MQSARFAGLATPILVMTALTDQQIDEQVRALGRDALLLRKPFDFNNLLQAVDKLLSPEQPSTETRGHG